MVGWRLYAAHAARGWHRVNVDERTPYAKRLIQRLNYMTLATADADGQPWNSPVFCAYDGEKTFYWGSRAAAQHSQNITANNQGFIAIYDSTIEPGHGEGFYAKAVCGVLVEMAEIDRAIALLHQRFGESYMTIDDVRGTAERRLYKAVVESAWVKNLEIDVREEVLL